MTEPELKKPEKEKTQATPKHIIAQEIDLFTKQMDSLAEILPLTMLAVKGVHSVSGENLDNFLKQECTATQQNGQTAYTVPAELFSKFQKLRGRIDKAVLADVLVPRVFLVSLVSQFDAFLGKLLRQLFDLRPDVLNASGNTLTFSQLVEFGSLDRAREYVVEKEIDALLRKSHAEQFDWLENKFALPLRVNLPSWPTFIEVTERRNLFVHTNGVVSHQYLEVCKRHGCGVDADLNIGTTLQVTPAYFEAAHECLLEIGVKLAQVLWRKLKPADIDEADKNLIVVCYELLSEGRFRLSRCLGDFATETLKKHGKEEHRLIMVINRAQAYKWSGDEEQARTIINAEDWSGTGLKFKIAVAVLLNDFTSALSVMKQIGASSQELNKNAYREWPLFREIRKTKAFATLFEEFFGEPLTTLTMESRNNQTVH